jgi:hypothetical protein
VALVHSDGIEAMKWRWLLVLVFAYAAWNAWQSRPVTRGPGVLAAAPPQQNELAAPLPALERAGYRITPLQSFSLEARVLASERYSFGREADLSPIDLALGWGAMSDSAVLADFDITQSGRFYYWHVQHFPIPRQEIETHSANMHMIAGTPAVERALKSVRVGQIVKLTGYLVEARAADGWTWRSSLTREDTGAGACELVWVTEFYAR